MEANSVDVKIITTEDPVDYDLEGVLQVQVQEGREDHRVRLDRQVQLQVLEEV